MTDVIRTELLTKRFGDTRAVNQVSIHVKEAEIYGFLGLNGAGKTTLIRLLLGMIRPESGMAALFNLLIGMLCAALLSLPGWSSALLMDTLSIYLNTTLMIIVLNTPVAFIAIWGKGYLPPLAVMILMLILAQILGVMGIGAYFPWTVPGLYSGSGGADMKAQLTLVSYLLIVITGIIGYFATVLYWKMADQTK